MRGKGGSVLVSGTRSFAAARLHIRRSLDLLKEKGVSALTDEAVIRLAERHEAAHGAIPW